MYKPFFNEPFITLFAYEYDNVAVWMCRYNNINKQRNDLSVFTPIGEIH